MYKPRAFFWKVLDDDAPSSIFQKTVERTRLIVMGDGVAHFDDTPIAATQKLDGVPTRVLEQKPLSRDVESANFLFATRAACLEKYAIPSPRLRDRRLVCLDDLWIVQAVQRHIYTPLPSRLRVRASPRAAPFLECRTFGGRDRELMLIGISGRWARRCGGRRGEHGRERRARKKDRTSQMPLSSM